MNKRSTSASFGAPGTKRSTAVPKDDSPPLFLENVWAVGWVGEWVVVWNEVVPEEEESRP